MTTTTSDGAVNAAPLFPAKDAPKAATRHAAGVPAAPSDQTSRSSGTEDATASLTGEGSGAVAPLVVGLDLSLVSTGIAHLRDGHLVTDTVRSKPGAATIIRLRLLRDLIISAVGKPDLLVLEGPSFASVGRGSHDRAGLYWMVRDRLWAASIPTAVAPPSIVKAYATGKGNSGKDAVIVAAVRRLPGFDGGNDQADAAWLAAMGADHLTGHAVVPTAQRERLGKVEWPTITRPR